MVVSGYSLDLYCDFENSEHRYDVGSKPDVFFDERPAVAWREARRAGWTFYDRRKVARCPICTKAKNKKRS